MKPTIIDIQSASERIAPYIHRTPVLTSTALNQITDAELFFKCENFQKIGAFKFRGACNAVFQLSEQEAAKGVATHSSGNHGAALALAAKTRGIPAYIVMPNNAPQVKKEAVAGYGARIIYCEPSLAARAAMLKKVVEETGAVFIHPYDNSQVIAGQGTVALELLAQCQHLEMIIAPIGGGGLLSGIATAVKNKAPAIEIIGAEPLLANDAYLSFKEKKLISVGNNTSSTTTLCDGLLASLSPLTFEIISTTVNDVFTASEQSILKSMKYIWERMKIIVEPSAAVTLAVVLEHPSVFKHKKIGLVLSGGNVDIKAVAGLF